MAVGAARSRQGGEGGGVIGARIRGLPVLVGGWQGLLKDAEDVQGARGKGWL